MLNIRKYGMNVLLQKYIIILQELHLTVIGVVIGSIALWLILFGEGSELRSVTEQLHVE
jgi:hypothetical protein